MRVIAGRLKGRTIPFARRRLGDVRVTPGRVKESVFSMLGADLGGCRFLDLFAGSGQIGLEACSRGSQVVMNEADGRRHAVLRDLLETFNLDDEVQLHRVSAAALVDQMVHEVERFDVIYLDPPYRDTVDDVPVTVWFLRRIEEVGLLSVKGVLLVQHDPRVCLPPDCGALGVVRERTYGDTSVTVYARTAAD